MALWVSRGTRNVLITTASKGHNLRALFNKRRNKNERVSSFSIQFPIRFDVYGLQSHSHLLLTVGPGTVVSPWYLILAGFSVPRLIATVALA